MFVLEPIFVANIFKRALDLFKGDVHVFRFGVIILSVQANCTGPKSGRVWFETPAEKVFWLAPRVFSVDCTHFSGLDIILVVFTTEVDLVFAHLDGK